MLTRIILLMLAARSEHKINLLICGELPVEVRRALDVLLLGSKHSCYVSSTSQSLGCQDFTTSIGTMVHAGALELAQDGICLVPDIGGISNANAQLLDAGACGCTVCRERRELIARSLTSTKYLPEGHTNIVATATQCEFVPPFWDLRAMPSGNLKNCHRCELMTLLAHPRIYKQSGACTSQGRIAYSVRTLSVYYNVSVLSSGIAREFSILSSTPHDSSRSKRTIANLEYSSGRQWQKVSCKAFTRYFVAPADL